MFPALLFQGKTNQDVLICITLVGTFKQVIKFISLWEHLNFMFFQTNGYIEDRQTCGIELDKQNCCPCIHYYFLVRKDKFFLIL